MDLPPPGGPPQAPQGHWSVKVVGKGSVTWSTTSPGQYQSDSFSYDDNATNDDDFVAFQGNMYEPSYIDRNITHTQNWNITYTVSLRYVDNNDQPLTPPANVKAKPVRIMARSSCAAYSRKYPGYENSITGQATDGFGKTVTASEGPPIWGSNAYDSYRVTSAVANRDRVIMLPAGGSRSFTLASQIQGVGGPPGYGFLARVSASCNLTARLDDRTVTIHRQGARGETVDDDGTVRGDTLYSFIAEDLTPIPTSNVFVPTWGGGPWSKYSDPSWPYDNVEVIWNGLGASYDYTPIYEFNTSIRGIYLKRISPYGASPASSDTLNLLCRDLGEPEKVEAEHKYVLTYHSAGDDWRRTGGHIEDTGQSDIPVTNAQPTSPGTPCTFSSSSGNEVTSSDYIKIDATFSLPFTKPYLDMPLSAGYQRSGKVTVSYTGGSNITVTAPAGAATVRWYGDIGRTVDDGTIKLWDASGPLGTSGAHQSPYTAVSLVRVRAVFFNGQGYQIP